MYIFAMWLCSQLMRAMVKPSAFADLYHRTAAIHSSLWACPSWSALTKMKSVLRLVAVWSIFCAIVHSAETSTNSTNSTSGTDSDQPLCGSTLDHANGVREYVTLEERLTIGMRD
jgi:hypothetical protein